MSYLNPTPEEIAREVAEEAAIRDEIAAEAMKDSTLDRISMVVAEYFAQYGSDGAHDAVCRIYDTLSEDI